MTWRTYIQSEPWRASSSLHIARRRQGGGMDVVAPFTFVNVAEGDLPPQEPAVGGSSFYADSEVREFLQAMSDAAWEIGIKPKQIESHADELKAVRYHLEDMRKLAAATLPETKG